MNGVEFRHLDGGLQRRRNDSDHISLLIVHELNVDLTKLQKVEDLQDLGVTHVTNPILHYHVSEFFRSAPGATLYVCSRLAEPVVAELAQLALATDGQIRQVGYVLPSKALDVTFISELNEVLLGLYGRNVPVMAVVGFHTPSGSSLTLPNLHVLDSHRVSVCISQDKTGRGGLVQTALGVSKTLTGIGTFMGVEAFSPVNQTIFWVNERNLVPRLPYRGIVVNSTVVGLEFDKFLVAGEAYDGFTDTQLDSLNDKGYIFLRKHVAKAGTYFNDSFTCTTLESDYCYREANRVSDKADRVIYSTLINDIGRNIGTDPSTGTILEDSAAAIEAFCVQRLEEAMGGEVSGISVFIDRDQRPIVDSKLVVKRKIVANAVLRKIIVESSLNVSV